MKLTPVVICLWVGITALSGSLFRIPFGAMVNTTDVKKRILILQ